MEKLKNKNVILIILISIFILFLASINSRLFRKIDTINYMNNSVENSVIEITNDVTIQQKINTCNEDIDSVELQFTTFNNRQNKGNINIKIFSNGEIVKDNKYDISKINDDEYIKVKLDRKYKNVDNLMVEISSENGVEGSSIGALLSNDDSILNDECETRINNIEISQILSMKINYISKKINYFSCISMIFILWIMIPLNIYKKIYNKYIILGTEKKIIKKYFIYLLLFFIAFILFSLRNLNYIIDPIIYGEDATYIENIFKNGFLKAAISTRTGISNDFQNTGSNILLFIALRFTQLCNGYDLTLLPVNIGIIGNVFLAVVGVIIYITFDYFGRKEKYIAFLAFILMPMGNTGMEVFGKVLNTVFIWPVLASMLLIILFMKKYNFGIKNIIISLLCMLSCLSFPITYGVVAIYLIFDFARGMMKKERFIKLLINNSILLVTILVGVYLLPSLLKAEGITVAMSVKRDSIIEFGIYRHILYPFSYYIFNHFNDLLTITMFLIYTMIIVLALSLNYKKEKIFNPYSMLLAFTGVYWLGDLVMRIKMTSLFNNYSSSYPDRYFYGCNVLFFLLLLYSLSIIFRELEWNKTLLLSLETLMIVIMLMNVNLFEMRTPQNIIYGGEYIGTFKECVGSGVMNKNIASDKSFIKVESYPRGWNMEIPYIYAIKTTQSPIK